jgi:Ca2+-transporting ATPase
MITIPPWKNKWLLLGVIIPFAIHLLILYTPMLSNIFCLSPLSWKEWKVVLKFSSPILIVEEILKSIGRYLAMNKNKEALNIF